MPDRCVLDSYALLALFTDERGADRVAAILGDTHNAVHISAINVGEVYYIVRRRRGRDAARQAETTIFRQPNLEVAPATWDRIRAAAEVKSEGGVSFADAFAAALAQELSVRLVTGDPEFADLERRGTIQVEWLGRR
ncbi:MAG: PIN domain-containing protein [Chloroflexi bacterium]|nr:PIN domain-containing protein [Chloroflexota bacterium]